jgi:hypothetical protein
MWDAEPISKPLAVPPVRDAVQPLFDRVHGWITTVDHKRLGILYIVYALFFFGDRRDRSLDHAPAVDTTA